MRTAKSLLLVLFVLMFQVFSFAQKKFFSGTIRDSINNQPISWASIRNINKGNVIISKPDGSFLMEASQGQILSFSANGYYTDTISIGTALWETGLVNILLRPLPSTLGNVVVMGNYTPYQRDSMARRREFLQVVGENKIPPVSRPNDNKDFGIAINLDHFGKTETNKRRARTLFDIIEEEAYINYRWNDTTVANFTTLRGDALSSFMEQYRPSYEWLRKHERDDDLLYYINDRLKRNKQK